MFNWKPKDRDTLIRTMYAEAAGEGSEGQAAVGHVILNRLKDDRWGNSIDDVAKAPKQFSAWNEGAGGNNLVNIDPNSEEYKKVGLVADSILNGQSRDNTGGATHYYSPKGMDKLVADGDQSNTIPKWLQGETDRRGEEGALTMGNHIFTGKANTEKASAAEQAENIERQAYNAKYAPDAITTASLDGTPTTAPMDQRFMDASGEWQSGSDRPALSGIDAFSTPAFAKEDISYGPGESGSNPSASGALSNIQDLSSGGGEDSEAKGDKKLSKLSQWLTDERKETLLALGTGLLSGDDWASGFAAAGQNVMGLRERNKDRAIEEQQRLAKAATGSSASTYNRPFNVSGRDPETGQEVVRSGILKDGVPYIITQDGTQVPAHEALDDVRIGGRGESQDVTAGAGGIPNASFVSENGTPSFQFQREGEQKAYGFANRAIGASADMEAMADTIGENAFTSVTEGVMRWAAANASGSITAAGINGILDEYGVTGAAQASMSAYLQGILRTDTGAAYTGTEITNYASTFLPSVNDNPETIAQKKRLRQRELYSMASRTGAAAPYLLGVIEGKYKIPGGNWEASSGALDSSNAGSSGDVPDGVTPEQWSVMTPEQKALWK